jgi:hypothetical protein
MRSVWRREAPVPQPHLPLQIKTRNLLLFAFPQLCCKPPAALLRAPHAQMVPLHLRVCACACVCMQELRRAAAGHTAYARFALQQRQHCGGSPTPEQDLFRGAKGRGRDALELARSGGRSLAISWRRAFAADQSQLDVNQHGPGHVEQPQRRSQKQRGKYVWDNANIYFESSRYCRERLHQWDAFADDRSFSAQKWHHCSDAFVSG